MRVADASSKSSAASRHGGLLAFGMDMDAGYPFEIRTSPIQGDGAFATEHIPAGTRVIEYAGQRLTPAEADARYPTNSPGRHHTYLFAIDDDVVIDAAVNGNEARFINHSCNPNCDAVVDRGRIWIETLRDIESGEELAYDYAYVLEERHTPDAKRRYPCHCGAPNCRGTILRGRGKPRGGTGKKKTAHR